MTAATNYPLPTAIVTAILLAGLHLLLRIAPLWRHRHQGCDAYYYLLCAEVFRRSHRLPIVLPSYYLLEPQEQAYPPLMCMLLGVLPGRWLTKSYWSISPIIDGFSMALLVVWVGGRYGLVPGILAGIAYSANASLLLEFSSLTSRPLALLLTNCFLIASFLWTEGVATALPVAAVLGVLLLYTHKLSVQLLWCLLPFLALTTLDWRWLVPFAVAYLVAFAIAPRLFLRILYAHWDIVSYWRRNWSLLGAHVVRQSPIYGGEPTQDGFYRRHDISWLLRQIGKVLDYNCFVLFYPLAILYWSGLGRDGQFALLWAGGTYLWGLATYLVPVLRCFGEGNKYFKYSLVPSLFIAASSFSTDRFGLAALIAIVCVAWTIYSYGMTALRLGQPLLSMGRLSSELAPLVEQIKSAGGARVICLPPHLCDLVAFHARCPVLWGGHNYEFKRLEAFFPVLRHSVETFVKEFGLTHLLLDKRYVDLVELHLSSISIIAKSDNYLLVTFDRTVMPAAIN